MSLKDALGFESFNFKHILEGLKNDPKRIFLGVDPLSTKGWNAVLGRNDKPIVNQLGGPTDQTYKDAQAAGVNTGTASTLHGIASVIAGAYGAGNAGGALGSASTAGPATGSIGGAAGGGAGIGAAIGETIPEVVVSAGGGGGAGATATGAGAAGGTAASSNSGNSKFNIKDILGKIGGQTQQAGQQQQMDEEKALDALARRGPPPNMGGANVGPVPVQDYQQALTPPRY